jgi:cytidylate kinase
VDESTHSAIQIAIDGPSASGKGTVAKAVATALGYTYLDSGALYRVVALKGSEKGLSLDDGPALANMISELQILLGWDNGRLSLIVADEELSEIIRTEAIGQGASRVAKLPEVRKALLSLQRKLATKGGIVMDGRDIGTVVLAQAQLKVFLTASIAVRAQRRHAEQLSRGIQNSLEEVTLALIERDNQDANREHAPLREASDAVRVDSSTLTPVEVVAEIVALAKSRNA